MDMNINELWVLEWSRKAKCFHIQRMRNTIESNLTAYASNAASDYLVVGVFETQDELIKAKIRLEETVRDVEEPTSASRRVKTDPSRN